jgi:nitrate reductase beta subunit
MNIKVIQDYNNTLVNNLNNINLEDYFKHVINNIYKNFDLTFMKYFLELCDHDNEFYINHNKLQAVPRSEYCVRRRI